MTKRDEAIEKAARELRALAKGEPRGFTSTVQRLDAIDKAEAALDAALSLPVDPPAPVEERERALVREAWCRGAVVAGQMSPEGTSRPDDVQLREWLASDDYGWLLARHPGMTPSDAIAAVDRSHPRAPTSDAAAYERAAQVCDAYEAERSTLHAKKHSAYQADFSDQDKAIGA